jgi:hypothetical protein
MENAKQMVLVDEKVLDLTPVLQAKQDMSWNRPSDQSVKSSINKQMKSTLNDQTLPEDVKAKQYRQQLNRFLQTKRKLPTVNESLDVKRPKRDSAGKRKSIVKRVSKRDKKKLQTYADIIWEN